MVILVYLSLSGMAADCQLVSDEGCRQLRSATSRTCVVRRTYSNYGDRCFAAVRSCGTAFQLNCDKLTLISTINKLDLTRDLSCPANEVNDEIKAEQLPSGNNL